MHMRNKRLFPRVLQTAASSAVSAERNSSGALHQARCLVKVLRSAGEAVKAKRGAARVAADGSALSGRRR